MALYAVFLYHPTEAVEPDPDRRAALSAEHEEHARELGGSGAMVFGARLTDADLATSIRSTGVVDGPFLETKEVVVGFYVIDAPDLDAALALARQNPIVHQGGGVEVRPIESGGSPEQAV